MEGEESPSPSPPPSAPAEGDAWEAWTEAEAQLLLDFMNATGVRFGRRCHVCGRSGYPLPERTMAIGLDTTTTHALHWLASAL